MRSASALPMNLIKADLATYRPLPMETREWMTLINSVPLPN